MVAPDTEKLIDDISGYFTSRKADMTPAGSIMYRRMWSRARTRRQYQDLSRQGKEAVDSWVNGMLDDAPSFEEPLRDVAVFLITQGEPLPLGLRRYVRKLLHVPVATKNGRGRPGGKTEVRDLEIVIQLDYLVEAKRLRPNKACAIVAKALRKAGINGVSKAAILKIWAAQKPIDASAKHRSNV